MEIVLTPLLVIVQMDFLMMELIKVVKPAREFARLARQMRSNAFYVQITEPKWVISVIA